MNDDRAQAIREAFGPGTSLYDAVTTKEVVEYFDHANCSEVDFVKGYLHIDDIIARQSGEPNSYQLWKQYKKDILFRLKGLGIDVEEL